MQWKTWDDERGICHVSGSYVISQRDGGRWLLEGHGLYEYGHDLELLKMTADDHARQRARVSVGAGAPTPPPPPAPIDTSEYPGDLRELSRVVKRLARVGLAVNVFEHREISRSREQLEAARDDLQRIIDRLP